MGKKSPRPPDPIQLGQQQQQANLGAARQQLGLNAIDRSGPFGSVQFTRGPGGVPTGQTVTLAPGLQQTSQQAQGAAANLSGLLPQDRFQLADVPQGMDLQNNFFNQQLGLLEPGFQRQLEQFNVRAGERGLPIGSEAEGNFLAPILEAQNLARQQAAFGAVQLTPQEEQRQIQNALLERQLPFQETGQALGLLGRIPVPGFAPQPTAGVAAPNIAGLAQQGFASQVGQQQAQNQALGDILQTAGTIGGGFLGGPGGAALGNRLFGAIPTG